MSLLQSQWLQPLFFQPRVDRRGNVVPKTRRARLGQFLFERGIGVPWIYSLPQCHAFWDVPAGQPSAMNRPEDYAHGPVTIMKYVLQYAGPWIERDAAIIEIGCNAGSKLNQVLQAGYANLAGLEINPACFDVLREVFPELGERAELHAGPAEQVLPTLAERRFDFIYSVSSLHHIHPTQSAAFDEIARVCGGFLLTLELEWAGGLYFFPRNYRRVFEARGFSQVASALITPGMCPEPELAAYHGHVIRLLRRRP